MPPSFSPQHHSLELILPFTFTSPPIPHFDLCKNKHKPVCSLLFLHTPVPLFSFILYNTNPSALPFSRSHHLCNRSPQTETVILKCLCWTSSSCQQMIHNRDMPGYSIPKVLAEFHSIPDSTTDEDFFDRAVEFLGIQNKYNWLARNIARRRNV
ncbi:hypothetical protein SADUNF_Sadunf12G0063500 [Salix dunnii]|uniref:Uncharacterized protein n=1 Tax=Salix dunnii TaxID=1413687 RepID=A0A835JKX7_9ROSI|nr:hypothetical protein SADUNF_Sadunf12G0063500 [Salix dunnii]